MIDTQNDLSAAAVINCLNTNTGAADGALSMIACDCKDDETTSYIGISTALQTANTINQAVAQVGQTALYQSMTTTANLQQLSQVLSQMQQIAAAAQNPGSDVSALNQQYQQQLASFNQIASQPGLQGGSTTLTFGPNTQVTLNLPNISSQSLGLTGTLQSGNGPVTSSTVTVDTLSKAQNAINQATGQLAATQSLIQGDLASQQSATLNSQASLSVVADTDIGAAVAQEAQNGTQRRAAIAATATANKMARETLQLFK